MSHELEALKDQERLRREVMMRRVLDTLRQTVLVVPLEPWESADDFPETRVEMTDASARVIAPLLEAVDILEAIIWASDQCAGHRQCGHSMEPWQRARALLAGKWQAYQDRTDWPTASYGDCIGCDNYILVASEAPYCPTCARIRREAESSASR
jgi:hypothetical protein